MEIKTDWKYNNTVTEADFNRIEKNIEENFKNNVKKVEGKGLSTNDFTNIHKRKLEELVNYDDSNIINETKNMRVGTISGGKNLFDARKFCEENPEYYEYSGNGSIYIINDDTRTSELISTIRLDAGTYTISGCGNSVKLWNGSSFIESETFTLTSTTFILPKFLGTGQKIYPQIEQGSIATDFEEYVKSNKIIGEELSKTNENLSNSMKIDMVLGGYEANTYIPVQDESMQAIISKDYIKVTPNTKYRIKRDGLDYSTEIKIRCVGYSEIDIPITDGIEAFLNDNCGLIKSTPNIGWIEFKTTPQTEYISVSVTINDTTRRPTLEHLGVGQSTLELIKKADELNSNLVGLGYGENGACNLLNSVLQTTQLYGVTCTSNGDGIYTLNGSTNTFPTFKLGNVYLEKGTYLIDSFSYDGDNPYLWVGKDGKFNNIINNYWTKPLTFTLDSKTLVSIYMTCIPGQNFSDKLMFPMLIKGTSEQKQYKPYIPSVKMLAEEISKQNESLSVIGKCKNLLNSTFDTYISNGVTFTRNDDGTYSLSGGRTDTSLGAYVSIIDNLPLEKGRYKLTGAVDENNYIRCIIKVSDSENRNIYDYGDGVVLNVNETDTTITLLIVSTDDTSQTRIIKPMLTTNLSATYDDFVPYTGDGDTFTHDVAELKNDLSTKIYELDGNNLWLCVSGKNCVLTLNGYNLTGLTNFSKLAEYPPYLAARNVVSKEDEVCMISVDPDGNIGASDLQVASSVTGKMFGEVSWVANI